MEADEGVSSSLALIRQGRLGDVSGVMGPVWQRVSEMIFDRSFVDQSKNGLIAVDGMESNLVLGMGCPFGEVMR